MEKPSAPIAETSKEDSPTLLRRVVKIISYPIAGAFGFWAADRSVHNNAYNTAKSLGMFDDILQKMTPISKKDIQDRIHGAVSKEKYLEQFIETKGTYQKLADQRLEHMGLNSFGKKWEYMSKSGKQIAVIEGLTVFGIAIGALLTMANSKTFEKFLSSHKNEGDQQR